MRNFTRKEFSMWLKSQKFNSFAVGNWSSQDVIDWLQCGSGLVFGKTRQWFLKPDWRYFYWDYRIYFRTDEDALLFKMRTS